MSKQSSSMVRKATKYIIMTIGLGIIGVILGAAGAFIIYGVIVGDSPGLGAHMVGIIGFLICYPVGIIVGIVIIKMVLHQSGSLLLGIVGGIFGEIFAAFIASPLDLGNRLYIGYPMFFLSAPVFCLVGFYLGVRIPSIWKRNNEDK
jgi:hypothetical protein